MLNMINCFSCNNKDEERVIFPAKYWKVLISNNQFHLGQSIVDLKRHAESLSKLTKEEYFEFGKIAKKLENGIKKAFKPTHFNWFCLMNNAVRNKQSPHVHWHLVPRYDKKIEINKEIFIDEEYCFHCDMMKERKENNETLKIIKKMIKNNI